MKMEHYYIAYIKVIDKTPFYFIKKYKRFTEIKNAPSVLEKFGMHTIFDKACTIADIHDTETKEQLFSEVHPEIDYRYSDNPMLSTNLRAASNTGRYSFLSKFSIVKKIISAKIPHWRILSHS